jgi:hypothetical protein
MLVASRCRLAPAGGSTIIRLVRALRFSDQKLSFEPQSGPSGSGWLPEGDRLTGTDSPRNSEAHRIAVAYQVQTEKPRILIYKHFAGVSSNVSTYQMSKGRMTW